MNDCPKNTSPVIGASLSEPHIDEFAVEFVYIIYVIDKLR